MRTLILSFRFSRLRSSVIALLGLLVASTAVQAQTAYTWNGGAGLWLDAPNWSPNSVPNSLSADVLVDGAPGTASVVTLGYTTGNAGVDFTVGRLRIDTGDRVEFSSLPNRLTFADTAFTGAGALILDGTLALPYSLNTLSGPKTISGAGRLVLGGPGQRPEVTGRTVNSAIIEGSAAFGRANASNFTVLNSGLIDANVSGQDIDFHGLSGANRSVNTGTMRATNGGKLLFGQGDWLNADHTVLATGTGSLLSFYRGGFLEGGTVSASGGGAIQVSTEDNNGYAFKDVTFSGPVSVGAGQMLVDGTVTNNDSITLPAGAIMDLRGGSNAVTLNGSGAIILDAPFSNRPQLIDQGAQQWTFQDVTVRGRGNVGYTDSNGTIDNVTLINRGSFIADRPGEVLHIDVHGLDNKSNGVLRADGGILRLAVSPIFNTGGLIEAINGGSVQASFARIEGGTVRNGRPRATPAVPGGSLPLGNMTLVNPGSGMLLEGNLTLGLSGASQEAFIIGEIENTGSLRIAASTHYARLRIGDSPTRSATLTGGGEVILGDAASGSADSGLMEFSTNSQTYTLTNKNHRIRGFGRIGDPNYDRWLVINNQGTIAADVPGKALLVELHSADNAGGAFRAASGGTLNLGARFGFNNANGTVEALSNSTVAWRDTRISSGTISSAPSGTLQFFGNGAADGGALFGNAGTFLVDSEGSNRTFNGLSNGGATLVNSGTLQKKNSSGEFALSIPINSTGAINVDGGVLRNFGGGIITGGTHTAALNAELVFQGAAPYTFSGTNTFSGDGRTALAETTTYLADAATKLEAKNFRFFNATLSGPGTLSPSDPGPSLSHSGFLEFYDNTSATISGARLLTLAGATASVKVQGQPFLFTNGAKWENSGTILLGGYTEARISGGAGTMLNNTGTVRSQMLNGGYGILDIPSSNAGRFEVTSWRMSIAKPSLWVNGAAAIAADTELNFLNPITFSGTGNTSTGAGELFVSGAGALAFQSGAKFAAERIQFNDATGASGPGELRVSAAASFNPNGATSVFSGTQVNLLSGSSTQINFFNGVLRLQDNAILRNAGTLNFRNVGNFELNSGAILENAGTMTITSPSLNPTFSGDNTGLLRLLDGSTTRGFPTNGDAASLGVPFEMAGAFYADSGYHVTFDRGGLFNETAKVFVSQPTSSITFTGADKVYRVRGNANEFPGLGFINFVGTTLQFEPSSIPANASTIAAGARVSFQGNNIVKGAGTLSTTGFVFQSGDQTVETATLETFGTADVSIWNAAGRKIEFKAGAQFRNGGRFVIQSTVGSEGNPGFTGENGTSFHNLSTGTLINDQAGATEFNLDFQNDGELEVRGGRFNFLKAFSGTGGLAVSGNGKISLSLGSAAINQLPGRLRATGPNSRIDLTLPGGQKLIRIDVNGGKLLATGTGSLVAAPGTGLTASNGGTLDLGSMDLALQNGGAVTAQGINTLLALNNLIGNDGSTLIGNDGSTLVAAGGMNLINAASASFSGIPTAANVNGLIALDRDSRLVGSEGAKITADAFVGNDGSTFVGNDGSTLIGNDGSTRPGPGRRGGAGTNGPGDPGSIVVASGSTLAGNGNFQGTGYVQTTAFLRPGKPVAYGGNGLGAMTWTGSIQVDAGATLFAELGGTTAGTQHDRINVSGAFALNGNLAVSFVNGFGSSVAAGDVFDIVTAGSAIVTNLAGTRVSAAGSNGTFEVQLINGGKTLRLANYQVAPVTFSSWASRYGLSGPNASMTADPNSNGIPNLLEYALGLDPTAIGGSRGTSLGTVTDGGQKYLSLSYTRPTGADAPNDIIYTPELAISLLPANWSASSVDILTHSIVPGPGTLETVTVRSTHPMTNGAKEFLHLKVTLTSP